MEGGITFFPTKEQGKKKDGNRSGEGKSGCRRKNYWVPFLILIIRCP